MRVLVVSDIHYACAEEQARRGHELRVVKNPIARRLLSLYRDYIWLKNPLGQNHLLQQFFEKCGSADLVIANGDYSCNTAFIGVKDDAARQSARECLSELRRQFGSRLRTTFGDHELGKMSLVGNCGGLRVGSWHCAINDLGLEPFWQTTVGCYSLIGVASTVIAFPVFEPESASEERAEWHQIRTNHLAQIRRTFSELPAQQKVILFCHDPTALPFLWREPEIRSRLHQVEFTIIGHLHSRLVFWKSKLLSGMPVIRFMGNTIRRFSTALNEARCWRDFQVQLCPSLAGIELLKDGGFLSIDLDPAAKAPAKLQLHRILR